MVALQKIRPRISLNGAAILFTLTLMIILTGTQQLSHVVNALAFSFTIIVFYTLSDTRGFFSLLAATCLIYIISSVSLCIFGIQIATMSESFNFACRGLTNHKNTFGAVVLFSFFSSILWGKSRATKYMSVPIYFYALLISDSITYLLLFITSLIALALFKALSTIYFPARIRFFIFLTMLVIIFSVLWAQSSAILEYFGRDDSFTGRTYLWQSALDVRINFFSGHGYDSALSDVLLYELYLNSGWRYVTSFHNTFLELIFQLGLLSAVTYYLAMLAVLMWTFRLTLSGRAYSVVPFWASTCFIVSAFFSSSFGPSNTYQFLTIFLIITWLFHRTKSESLQNSRHEEPRNDFLR